MGCNDPKEKIYPPVSPVPGTLEPATADRLGGVKIGNGINVTEDGTISTSGGGGGVYEILVTRSQSDDPNTADKTFEEIKAAYESGLSPVCAMVLSGYDRNHCDRFPLVQVSPYFYKFGGVRVGDESWLEVVFIDIDDNSVDITYTELYSAE